MLFSPIMANRKRRCSAPDAAWCANVSDQASILAISAQIDLDALGFDLFALPSSQLVPLVLLMLRRLGLSEMLGEQKIGEFIHLVRIHYNDAPPYHSFIHAVDVVHFAYLTLRRCPDVLLPLDKLTLIVAALCHDVSAPTPPLPPPCLASKLVGSSPARRVCCCWVGWAFLAQYISRCARSPSSPFRPLRQSLHSTLPPSLRTVLPNSRIHPLLSGHLFIPQTARASGVVEWLFGRDR